MSKSSWLLSPNITSFMNNPLLKPCLYFQVYCSFFGWSKHIPIGPFAPIKTRQISRRWTHPWFIENFRLRKIGGLPKVLRKPQRIRSQFGAETRRQFDKNETFDFYAIGRDEIWNQIWWNGIFSVVSLILNPVLTFFARLRWRLETPLEELLLSFHNVSFRKSKWKIPI